MSGFFVGFGEGDITPRGCVALRGQYHVRLTEEVREPIKAVAVAMEANGQRAFWAACDLCGISANQEREVYEALAGRIPGLRPEELIFSATHIHTGPYLENAVLSLNGRQSDEEGAMKADDCRAATVKGIADAILTAYGNRRESYAETAVARVRTGVNRRMRYADNANVMYGDVTRPDFLGSESRDGGPVQLMYVYAADGGLTGVIASVPCTAQVVENKYYITPDYWGAVRREVRAALGEVPVLGLVGAAGDLSPHLMIGLTAGAPNSRDEDGKEELGRRIAAQIVARRARPLARYDGGDFAHLCRTVTLPFWKSTAEQYRQAQEYLASLQKIYGEPLDYEDMRSRGFRENLLYSRALAWIERYEMPEETFSFPVHALRVGRAAFITSPFELFIEYADRMRAALRGVQLFDAELTGQDWGYLATRRAVAGGGYSAMIFSGCTGPEGGEILVRESVEALRFLFA